MKVALFNAYVTFSAQVPSNSKARFFMFKLLPIVLAFMMASCATQNSSCKSVRKDPLVKTNYGILSGSYSDDGNVERFAGIPYAKPPVGELRWKEPQKLEAWNGVRKAKDFAPIAYQKRYNKFLVRIYSKLFFHDAYGFREYNADMSEDCLYLNVWRPAGVSESENLPVFVYIHGGSLVSGSSIGDNYDGETFAKNGIIMVTVAYRLGVLGYLALDELAEESPNHTTGNYGLLDQVEALKWVHENIKFFGGNPENITIGGESAGSTSVNALCSTPLAKGLFQKAVGESSGIVSPKPPHTFRTLKLAKEIGENIKKEFKASSVSDLRKIPAKKLVSTSFRNDGVTIDGYALTEYPNETYKKGNNNEKALLNGFNFDDGAFVTMIGYKVNASNYEKFVSRFFGKYTQDVLNALPAKNDAEASENWKTIATVYLFANSHHDWSRLVSSQGKDVYLYRFSKSNGGIGSNHTGEIMYAYGNVPESKFYDKADKDLEKTMVSYWTNFAKTGNPNGEGLAEWKKFNDADDEFMNLDVIQSMQKDPNAPLYDILSRMMADDDFTPPVLP